MQRDYYLYKYDFLTDVHFGSGSLDDSKINFCADTLFSALCIEAVRRGTKELEQLVNSVKTGELLLSDSFPYIGRELFLPKPFIHVENSNNAGDSVIKKTYKKMEYIPADLLDSFTRGEFPLERADDISRLGRHITRTRASVRREEDTLPYRVGIYRFNKNCGLYSIVACENDSSLAMFEDLLESLSLSGIGGKRSSGLGRFDVHREKVTGVMGDRLNNNYQFYMTLSGSLPEENELPKVLKEAHYMLQKRSGFVASENYAEEYMRKRDLYVFQTGSCFSCRFDGTVQDVSSGGAHPVYRYAKPIMLGVMT